MAVALVLQAALSFRGAAAALALFAAADDPAPPTPPATPCAGAIRAWVLRLGYAGLTRPLSPQHRWAWLIDHTMQIGAQKLFVMVGVPLDQAPFGVRPLELRDLHLIALTPMLESNQRLIDDQREQAVARTGAPRPIVGDGAADGHRGVERFPQRHPHTVAVTDAAHRAAHLLKHYGEKDPRWQEYTQRLVATAAAIRQTPLAWLLPPRLRNKARFLSVSVFVRFGCLLLARLRAAPEEEVVRRYGWVAGFASELAAWQEQSTLVQVFLRQVRVEGLFARAVAEWEDAWGPLTAEASPTTQALRGRLRGYVAAGSRDLPAHERLLASTEVLESTFGVQKRLGRDQAQSGLTGLSLGLGAAVGERTAARVRADREAAPEKQATGWARRLLGRTVQWLRRRYFGERRPRTTRESAPVPDWG